MISTRGVKFKFSSGEKVLCYEPDPTKAKVLYESKVLDLVANRDSRGRKTCEYLIHFYGWNSSWDRYVKEEFILPYTEENRELQSKLAEEAALSLKGKKRHKLPPLIKETLSKKMCAKSESQEAKQPKSPPHSSSDTESSEDEVEREVTIKIPDVLKAVLEEDCILITQKNKFLNLPCQSNVIGVLEGYVKHYAHKIVCGSASRNAKNGKRLALEDVRNKLNLCKEAMDGLRVFFDFTLPHLLLYRQEKKQYYTIGTICKPVNGASRDCDDEQISTRTEVWERLLREYQPMDLNNEEMEFPATEILETSTHILALKHGLNLRNKLIPMDPVPVACSETNVKNVQSKVPQNVSPKEKTSKNSKVQSKTTTTRILRSSDKQKQQAANDELSPSVNVEKNENNCVSPKSSDCPPEPTSPLRVTRKSGHTATSPSVQPQASPSSTSCDKSLPNSPTSSIPNIEQLLSQSSSNYCSSSNSSTHSTISNVFLEAQHHHLLKPDYASFVHELVYWKMVPDYLYEQIPSAPSLIYGAHHLLRLFVKLPALISNMSIKQKKLEVLLEILENFLLYLADESHRLFLPSAYKDGKDIFPVGSLGMV